MKTKFILHGGFDKERLDEDNREFYTEILKDAPESPKILLVFFAQDIERVPVSAEKTMTEFNRIKESKKLTFEVADEESFYQQVKSADVIYLAGGTTFKLLETLKKFPELKDLLDGKTIAGSSAGANVLGKFFYSPSADKAGEGLGLLPLKIIPHYSEKFKGKLDDVGRGLETLLLPEYEYKIFQ